ncbi:hypothetical protein G4Z16_02080 [Streptomyces bathyalis]|uniref:Uncharacterized protein n=1 Tax=Streptomyces bathyalis TaxID=2710756 RepID=A0A7T1T2U0_9ACTN|nr:hypothetical protein [Streptomyces bathyalis]QPP05375.1 hypothetical protein G4Z16_02080 [Streptomyces bathyalis]
MRIVVLLDAPQHGSEQDTSGPGQTKRVARSISPECCPGPGGADTGTRLIAGGSAGDAIVLAGQRHSVGSAGQMDAVLEREPVDCA